MDKETQLSEAIEAALDNKAQDAVVLELVEICSFTDYFLICTGTSTRHNQTIADHIEETLKKEGVRPLHIFFLKGFRSEEHTSELQSLTNLVCRLLLEKKKKKKKKQPPSTTLQHHNI